MVGNAGLNRRVRGGFSNCPDVHRRVLEIGEGEKALRRNEMERVSTFPRRTTETTGFVIYLNTGKANNRHGDSGWQEGLECLEVEGEET